MRSSAIELAHEQVYVAALYERLDALRARTGQRLSAVRLGPTAENDQAWSEREAFAELYQDRGAELDAAERNLCFGRLDFDAADRLYIGRLGLRNDEHDQLLVDWRAPAAQPFYRATAVQRYGVTRRRHLHTVRRRVVRYDDDVLDLDAVDPAQLTGEAALLAALNRSRTGRMGDIVATIQADQDRIIRDVLNGILVVDGGPGTGKTVVALHRAAYLLYTYREQLSRRGILVVGPTDTFLRYIDQVLPSLGENDVVLATIGSLFPGVTTHRTESPRAARVKGRHRMATALERAVAGIPGVRNARNEARYTPEQVLALLYAEPHRLDLADDERAAIHRDRRAPWTIADVPLLDELAELLGPLEATERAARQQAAEVAAEQAEAAAVAAELVQTLAASEAIVLPPLETETFVEWIASRGTRETSAGSLAARALADRTWAYGHVIVDEAQELSPMAWRMLLRRCPSRSMTVVGDIAQTSASDGAESWAGVFDALVPGRWRTARLTLNYRTPRSAIELAAGLLPPSVEPPVAVRDVADEPWRAASFELADVVRREAGLVGAGRVAVIAPPGRIADVADMLNLGAEPDLEAPVTVLAPAQAKGLEFDSVVVVDPSGIEQAAPRGRADLYVALTRTTRRLGVVTDDDWMP